MTLYTNSDNMIYHIHIPRTGGRYIKNVFEENGYKSEHDDWNNSLYGISFQHLHYPLYECLENVSDADHFTVVRNPFMRFCSAINAVINASYHDNAQDIINSLESKRGLENFIEYISATIRYNSNWLRPQHEFISPKTKIYRFEDDLGKNFISWINKTYNESFEVRPYEYYGSEDELKENTLKENKKIESLIKDYYKKDYELFDY